MRAVIVTIFFVFFPAFAKAERIQLENLSLASEQYENQFFFGSGSFFQHILFTPDGDGSAVFTGQWILRNGNELCWQYNKVFTKNAAQYKPYLDQIFCHIAERLGEDGGLVFKSKETGAEAFRLIRSARANQTLKPSFVQKFIYSDIFTTHDFSSNADNEAVMINAIGEGTYYTHTNGDIISFLPDKRLVINIRRAPAEGEEPVLQSISGRWEAFDKGLCLYWPGQESEGEQSNCVFLIPAREAYNAPHAGAVMVYDQGTYVHHTMAAPVLRHLKTGEPVALFE